MNLRHTSRSLKDLAAIGDFISQHHRTAARRIEDAIRDSADMLSRHPKLGRERPELACRALGVARHPYTIYYRLEDDAVVILHIRDDRRLALVSSDL